MEWRQCAEFSIRPKSLASAFSSSSSILYSSSVNPYFRARFKKALIHCLCCLVRCPPQTGRAYVMRDSIRALNTACISLGGRPWLLNSFNKYIRWEQTVNTKFTWSSKLRLALRNTSRSLATRCWAIGLQSSGRGMYAACERQAP